MRELFRSSHPFLANFGEIFRFGHPNPGKKHAENFTKISRQLSRHLWQKENGEKFHSALLQGSCSENLLCLIGGRFQFPSRVSWFPWFHSTLARERIPSLRATFVNTKETIGLPRDRIVPNHPSPRFSRTTRDLPQNPREVLRNPVNMPGISESPLNSPDILRFVPELLGIGRRGSHAITQSANRLGGRVLFPPSK